MHLNKNVHGKIQNYEKECISQRETNLPNLARNNLMDGKNFEKSRNLPNIKKANSDDVTKQPSKLKGWDTAQPITGCKTRPSVPDASVTKSEQKIQARDWTQGELFGASGQSGRENHLGDY